MPFYQVLPERVPAPTPGVDTFTLVGCSLSAQGHWILWFRVSHPNRQDIFMTAVACFWYRPRDAVVPAPAAAPGPHP